MAFNLKHRWLNENSFGWKEGRYIYAGKEAPGPDEAPKAKEAAEGKKEAPAKPLEHEAFKQKRDQANGVVDKIAKGFPNNKQAENLQNELRADIDKDFNKLEEHYSYAKKVVTDTVGTEGKEGKEKLAYFTKKAEELIQKIQDRVGDRKAEKTIRHRELQAQLDDKDPTKAKEAKNNIVIKYLDGQNVKSNPKLVPYIVEALGDQFDFRAEKPEDLKANLDKVLADRSSPVINNAVRKLVDTTPAIDMKADYSIFKDMIEEGGPDLYGGFGHEQVDRVAKVLASLIKVEKGDDGKPSLFIHLDPPGLVETPEEFKKSLPKLKLGFASKEAVEPQEKAVEKAYNDQQDLFKGLKDGTFSKIEKLSELDNRDLDGLLIARSNMDRMRAEALKRKEGAKTETTTKSANIKPAEQESETKLTDVERTALVEKCIDSKWFEDIKKEVKELGLDKNLDFPEIEAYFKKILTKLPDGDLRRLEKGEDIPFNAENIKAIKESFCELIGIKKLNDGGETEKGKVLIQKLDKFDATFGKECKIAEVIARGHDVKQEGNGPIKIDGNEIKELKELGQYLFKNSEALFKKMIDGKPSEEDRKAFNELINSRDQFLAKEQNSFKFLEEYEAHPEKFKGQAVAGGKESKEGKPETSEKLGSIEAIGVLIQMYAMFKAGDWESLNEAMADFTAEPPKNPMKVMKECSDAYEKKISEIAANTPASDLLEAYLKPRGPEANKLFPGVKNGEPPLGRYRGAMCPIIAKQFENQLGISPIEKISREGGTIVIDGNKGNEKVSVHIYKKDNQLMAGIGTFETKTTADSKGKETTNTTRSTPANEVSLGGVDVKLSDVKLTPATKPAPVAETPSPKAPEAPVAPAPTLVASARPSASQSKQGNPGKDQQ